MSLSHHPLFVDNDFAVLFYAHQVFEARVVSKVDKNTVARVKCLCKVLIQIARKKVLNASIAAVKWAKVEGS